MRKEIENLNKLIASKEIESLIKNFSTKLNTGPESFALVNFANI